MGYISRKIFPVCGRMCICCPALRASSRQPVKRYKKLVTDIFPKTPDGQTSDRKIVKLCEYAAKNPLRIPKITKYLEERLCKELRYGHQKIVNVIMEAYKKLLCTCSNHMAYFASSVLNITDELLDSSKHAAVRVAGCQTLSKFIHCQIDGTYARNIENLVPKVCMLASENGEHQLQASSLQCLEAMIWFMAEFSNIFEGLDEIVHVVLENYEPDMHYEDGETGDQRHHWVDEVVRCKGKTGIAGVDGSPSRIIVRPRPVKKDPTSLTREEDENPKVWAQICLQRMAELARESSTMRRILEPMFVYFDNGYLWAPQQSLSLTVLSDMCYFVDISENQQLILGGLVRHLDHKNVVHDPLVKSYVVRKATYLASQIRSGGTLLDSGCISDLCRHLRKSLQATSGQVSEHECNLNIQLQNSIEACLLETVRGMKDAGALFDLMAITLDKLPPVAVVARATVGSIIILVHVFASASVSPSQQVFPESLLVPLLKAMLHTDTEARVGAHYIFSVLLFPSSNCTKHHGIPWRASCCRDRKRRQLNSSSTIASVTALLEKLRKEKDGVTADKLGSNSLDDNKFADFSEADMKQGWAQKNSPSVCKITSFVERAAGDTSFMELEPYAMKLNEDQVVQLLSGFWIQANLPDNLPSNYEAIAHSYCWTLVFAHQKNSSSNLVTRFFQLPLSLRSISLDPNCGKLPSACKRSLYVTAMAMFMFAANLYHFNDVIDLLSTSTPYDVDPCLGISEDLHLYVKPVADVRQYCSAMDNQTTSMLFELYKKSDELDKVILDLLVGHLSNLAKVNKDDMKSELVEAFSLEDAFIFTPQAVYELEHIHMFGHAKESPNLDHHPELSANSVAEEEGMSSCMSNAPHLIAKAAPLSPSMSNIVSIGQLLESALEVAGQVAGTSVSTSPLPYSAMASQCEALGTGTRKKLSTWLVHDNIDNHQHPDSGSTHDDFLLVTASPAHWHPQPALISQVAHDMETLNAAAAGGFLEKDSSLTLRLPPASPFDNFLRAVSGPAFTAPELAM